MAFKFLVLVASLACCASAGYIPVESHSNLAVKHLSAPAVRYNTITNNIAPVTKTIVSQSHAHRDYIPIAPVVATKVLSYGAPAYNQLAYHYEAPLIKNTEYVRPLAYTPAAPKTILTEQSYVKTIAEPTSTKTIFTDSAIYGKPILARPVTAKVVVAEPSYAKTLVSEPIYGKAFVDASVYAEPAYDKAIVPQSLYGKTVVADTALFYPTKELNYAGHTGYSGHSA